MRNPFRSSGARCTALALLTCLAAAWGTPVRADEPATEQQRHTEFRRFVRLTTYQQLGWIDDWEASADGRKLHEWLLDLGSADAAKVSAAREVLGRQGAAALPWIGAFLAEPDPALRAEATAIAVLLVEPGAGATAAQDRRPWVRRVALAAAALRGGLSAAVLTQSAGDDDPVVRREALRALASVPAGTAARRDVLARHLLATESDIAAEAALALASEGSEGIARLAEHLALPAGRHGLGPVLLRRRSAQSADALSALLASPQWPLRSWTATALAFAPELGPRSLAALTQALTDASGDVRWRAAWALARETPVGAAAVAALTALLADPDPEVSVAAACALAAQGIVPPVALEALMAGLTRWNVTQPQGTDVIHISLWAKFGDLGAREHLLTGRMTAEPALTAFVRHGAAAADAIAARLPTAPPVFRRNAVGPLGALGAAGRPGLRLLLDAHGAESEDDLACSAALALARQGEASQAVVEALARNVAYDPRTRLGSRWKSDRLDALKSLGLDALPGIRAALRGGDDRVMGGLVAALVALGSAAVPALPEILALSDAGQLLPDEESSSTSYFEKAVRSVGASAVPGLREVLAGEDARLRARALDAALLLGPLAKGAVPALRDALAKKRIPGHEEADPDALLAPIEEK